MTPTQLDEQAEALSDEVAEIMRNTIDRLTRILPNSHGTRMVQDKLLEVDMWANFAIHEWRVDQRPDQG